MTPPKFSSLYDHHEGPEISDFGPSLTKQEFKDEADINNILSSYQVDGILPDLDKRQPIYADCTAPELVDFQLAQNMVATTSERFASLPAKVRERFANDAVNMLLFLQDPDNRDEAVRLGLVNPAPESKLEKPPSEAPAKKEEVK